MRILLYVMCIAGEFVWNEGGVVQLPAPYITLCDFLLYISISLIIQNQRLKQTYLCLSFWCQLEQILYILFVTFCIQVFVQIDLCRYITLA